MGKVLASIDEQLAGWLAAQHVFFVATAPLAADGHVNLSPRGGDCLSVLGPHRVAWVDWAGSGAETAAHLRENGRITLMFCAFEGSPSILRLHGTGRVALPGDPDFETVVAQHPPHPATRAVVVVDVHRISDSCGNGVPLMAFQGDRDAVATWGRAKGPQGIADYVAAKNAVSLDGLPAFD